MGERSRSNLVVLALGVGLVLAGAVPGGASSTSPAAVSPAATRGRYVAFGDSVPYGYGLANPGTKKRDGLPPNQGPSPRAYPTLLAKSLNLTLKVRTKACTLTGDQLSVSGAPAVAANVNGPDSGCGSTGPHKSVDPNELNHLGKAPAKLVTLQVGADDIDFGGCLMHELGISVPYKIFGQTARNCIDGSGVTNSESSRLSRFRIGLNNIINAIRRQQRNTTIVVLNYYQPLPAPSQFVTIDQSFVCKRLATDGRGKDAYLHAVIIQNALNRAISGALERHTKVRLVNLAGGSSFDGHAMCTKHPYLFTGGPADSFWRFSHPNAAGQKAIAAAILAKVPGLRK